MKLRLGLPIVLIVALCYSWPSVSDFGWNLYQNNYTLTLPLTLPPRPPSEALAAPALAAPLPVAVVPKARKPSPVAVVRAARPVVDHWTVIVLQEVPLERVYVPQAVDAPPAAPASTPIKTKSDSDPYDSKTKRGIKAIGRFLKRQY